MRCLVIIIIIIFSYLNWVAISQRPPVSHKLTYTHNQITSNSKLVWWLYAVGHLLIHSQVGGGGGGGGGGGLGAGKKTPNDTQVGWCPILTA